MFHVGKYHIAPRPLDVALVEDNPFARMMMEARNLPPARERSHSSWHRFDSIQVPVLSREDLITAKKAAGRLQDQIDLESLVNPAKSE
jgi:hypothetical protein